MSQFIESIKIEDQKPFLLNLHQKRVNETFAYFGKEGTVNLEAVVKALDPDENGLFKLRVVYSLDHTFSTRLIPYAISSIESFELVEHNFLDYAFKSEDRKIFDQMKARAKSPEIIIVKNNHITDTSFSNLLFKKGKTWYTPCTCLLNGVQRQHLLKTKKIKEADITLQNIREYSHFQLINALNDFDDMFIYPLSRIRNLPGNDDDFLL
ncbi:aminotransferase class IV [Chryseobacterium sp. MFBS3-17]|uniref:aminotransferase class IV n=1 Tax=Chryseobacterium sp. MFBS3-17 TaxID=2886689 RepID=UPI001D0DE641|nr:aminotransferase class IV [Chryseobacterium sp. MFBS3-17]MCC2591249.1 aminotransferase class IV [Chryseobacterium sp. MFBS3-17]